MTEQYTIINGVMNNQPLDDTMKKLTDSWNDLYEEIENE